MTVDKIRHEIVLSADKAGFIRKAELIDETDNTLKLRLLVSRACFVQVYVNTRKNIINYVVVLNGQRIFGLDCDGGRWHQHPWSAPNKHQPADNISLDDFLFDAYEKLKGRGII
ncbi:hypothetical protein A2625_00745 [candidate division WOR-1 bacterium RIFCSPHIGHO2_01_FULL_53_15]|uniref:Uncharacterized protein n=1 Tax=candidate division WOR-1 bacterium RIFCSPHIGHO2_01_FULL_53_15 TaxID=1802564 RepID=A0A1F4Q5F0_UNCSA|nr:MAG: hypothetical protein A2625_00745 [candidate division WOR-1 bacterium RIFCSPHIGHO2_01_FULL_53_15]OGC12692.1 MAG: hypothetical protein A3D23_03010 [candidate division WOR-1 bacterium RIFCSPHIGHO2_02_FULL_53_26]